MAKEERRGCRSREEADESDQSRGARGAWRKGGKAKVPKGLATLPKSRRKEIARKAAETLSERDVMRLMENVSMRIVRTEMHAGFDQVNQRLDRIGAT